MRSRFGAGDYWSVHQFTGPERSADRWYVNFELPSRRTSIGIDSFVPVLPPQALTVPTRF